MNEEGVKQFIESNLAPNGQFRSLSQWAQAANLTVSTLHGVRRTGRADPDTLIKIGAAIQKTPVEMFVLAGWLDEPRDLNEREREWLTLLRSVPEDLQALLVDGARGLTQGLNRPQYRVQPQTHLRIAEDNQER